ncbi:type IV pilin protein [Dyella koreensis]|uniref:Prepilin-type N-terminal cleavage/methylation domain-containing protein n=1 Tax=Dyella koreensis TaxID=311235 RepID=A0ABW8K619_9GAMM
MSSQAGVTLIEVMIVVVIIAILAAIAYPSYTKHVTKTRRVAAEACLANYANYMERYYTTNLRYDQDSSSTANPYTQQDCATAAQTGNYYNYPAPSTSAATYVIQAVPQNKQATNDAQCGTLSMDQTGTRSVSGTAGVAGCW